MTDIIHFLTIGIVLGLAAGISPGPMLALVISQTLRHNRAEGMKIAFAPLLTDTPIVILTLFVLSKLSNSDIVLGIIAILGGVFVSYLAYESFKTKGMELNVQPQKPQSIRKAIMANMFNPHPYVFWLTIGATTLMNANQKSTAAMVVFIVAFYVMLVGSKVSVALIVDKSRDFLKNKAYIWTMRILGLLLLGFAVFFIKDGIGYILSASSQNRGEIFTYTSDELSKQTSPYVWEIDNQNEWPVGASEDILNIEFTGRFSNYTKADTWYPSWASDGNLYSGWTDGTIGDMEFVWSALGEKAPTGQAKIVGENPMDLTIVNLGTHISSALPYQGRYPCGSLVYNGVWYYGTYSLHQPVDDVRKDFGWYVLGPFVGFRWSTDYGQTWNETPHTAKDPIFDDPSYEEFDMKEGKVGPFVKLGAPHFVDFGKNMEHSPDGKAYLVGHGASSPDKKPRIANNSWNTGDEIYLSRVTPSVENMNDASQYEFFGGRDKSGAEIWTKEYSESKPIFSWNNRCGIVTMTYNAPLEKYLMCITHAHKDSTSRGAYDTYLLESEKMTGPWKMINYMKDFGRQAYFVNIPSKFISEDGQSMWLCYSANYMFNDDRNNKAFLEKERPKGSAYSLSLHEVKLFRNVR